MTVCFLTGKFAVRFSPIFVKAIFFIWFLILASPLPIFSQQSASIKKLSRDIQQLLSQYFLENSHWGIGVQSLKTGEWLYSQNHKKNFIPASTQKILTTLFALEHLGSDYRFVTRVYLTGRQDKDSVWTGDVVIRGSGDPSISGRFHDGKVTAILEAWADSLIARSLKIIRGRVIGDDDLFSDEVMGSNWDWDYESDWYSAQISALSFNDNCVDWYVTPMKAGARAKIQVVPNTKYITIDNHLVTVVAGKKNRIEFDRKRCANRIAASGQIAAGSGVITGSVTIDNPTLYFATVFMETLERKGITVEHGAHDIDDLKNDSVSFNPDSSWIPVASYQSPKLSELLKVVNKRSQNFYAEQILRAVAAELTGLGDGNTALKRMRPLLTKAGIDTNRIVLRDGSGYAHSNLISPADLISVLSYIRRHEEWKAFRASLPVAGADGTLHYRMKDSEAAGNVRAKTGYIEHARNIAGYVATADGEELLFAILCNHFTVDKLEIEKVQDAILIKLAQFTRY